MTEQDDPRGIDDEGDGDEGDEAAGEETNGHVQFGTSGVPVVPAPTQTPRTPRKRRGRPGGPPPGRDAWEAPGGKGTRVSAMEIWPDLLEELKTSGKTPYDLAVRVVVEDPPPTRPIGNAFDASAIVGDRSTSPSDKLFQMVRDNYHMTWAKTGAIYDVQFVWKDGGKIARRGQLIMPHPDEILAMKQVGAAGYGGAPGGYHRPQMPMPPQQPQPSPPQWGGSQYEQPPRQWSQQTPQHPWGPPPNDEALQLRAELQRERENSARMAGQMDEILKAIREGRVPNTSAPTPPAPAAAPPASAPAQQVDLDGVVLRILDRMGIKPGFGAQPAAQPAATAAPQPQLDPVDSAVLRILDRFGIKPGMPGIGVGAQPPPGPKTAVDEAEAAFNAFERMLNMMGKFRGFTKKADKIFSEDPIEAVGEAVEDAKDGKLPFDAVVIPEVKWGDGRPVMYTSGPDGKVDWTAAAFANPAVVEKVADGLNRFMSTLGRVVQAASRQQAGVGEEPEVVDETPPDAKDADGGSWGGLG